MTTDEIMRMVDDYRWAALYGSSEAYHLIRDAVDTLVAERDALRTERDALRQVIEQQLLNVPVGEWKK